MIMRVVLTVRMFHFEGLKLSAFMFIMAFVNFRFVFILDLCRNLGHIVTNLMQINYMYIFPFWM